MDSDDKNDTEKLSSSEFRVSPKKPDEDSIEKYTELADLEALYSEVLPVQLQHTPRATSDDIRRIAESHLSRVGEKANVVQMGRPNRITAAFSGLSLAAGLVLGIFIANYSDNMTLLTSADGGQGVVFMGGDAVAKDINNLNGSGADIWQKQIAEYVLLGEMKKAETLNIEFNKRFPDFGKHKKQK
jgi:hypothetical protein